MSLCRHPGWVRPCRVLVLVLAGGWASAAAATPEHYYRWYQADGTPVFSGRRPPPTVQRYDVLRYTPASVIEGLPPLPPPSRSDNDGAHPDADARDLLAAREALDEALQNRAEGREPLPGERQSLANGHSRLRPDYFERQQALDDAVTDAVEALREARTDAEAEQ